MDTIKEYSIQYAYAMDADDTLIHITQASHLQQYTCPGCSGKLTPVLGEQKAKHFRHFQDCCSSETYLHKCAKEAFLYWYTHALSVAKPITLKLERQVRCTGGRSALLSDLEFRCQKKEPATYDMTKLFDTAELEKYDNTLGLKPDIMLSDSGTSRRCYVEICVTHPCSEEKINSGIPILEFKITSESDIQMLLSGTYAAADERLKPYNFSPKPKTQDTCSGLCTAGHIEMTMWSMNETGRLKLEYASLQDVDLGFYSSSNTWPASLSSEETEKRLIGLINDIDPNHQYRLCLRCKYSTRWDSGYMNCTKKSKRVPYTEARQCSEYENSR